MGFRFGSLGVTAPRNDLGLNFPVKSGRLTSNDTEGEVSKKTFVKLAALGIEVWDLKLLSRDLVTIDVGNQTFNT